jgi:anti-sigma factor RsiW
MSSSCRRWLPVLEAFMDGELSPDRAVEVEQHLAECRTCQERLRFDAALRASTRRVVRSAVQPSAAFEARVRSALAGQLAEDRLPATSAADDAPARGGMLPWRGIVPVAAAAALTLAWAAARSDQQQIADSDGRAKPHAPPPTLASLNNLSSPASLTVANIDQLLEELVDYHAQGPTPEITEPSLVPQLEPEVGVPVRIPSLQQYGARWEGGGVVPVRNQRAASLRYRLGGHRVTLYVYNSTRFPLRAMLEPRVVRNEPVYVGVRRGYSIAAKERRGVGYAVTADLDDRESAELVASIH